MICPIIESGVTSDTSTQVVDHDFVGDLKKAAVLGEPIVGIESVTLDHRGQGARSARILPSPKELSPAEIARHNILHFPFEFWCPICIAARRPNDHHRLQHDHSRDVPLLVGDYCFVRNSGDDNLMCVLVMKLYPFGLFFACMVPKKGYNEDVIEKGVQIHHRRWLDALLLPLG